MKKTIYDDFPKTNKTPQPKEIWLAYYPYEEKGNYEKLRPVYIIKANEEDIEVNMITSNSKKGKAILNDKSYLTNKKATIKIYKFYRKLKEM